MVEKNLQVLGCSFLMHQTLGLGRDSICGKSSFKKCGTSPKIRIPQILKTFKYAPFGNHSTPPLVSKHPC
jgi:hypothetical protein